MPQIGKHDDVEYQAVIKIDGEEFTQQIFGSRNEKVTRDYHRASVVANNKAHPDNKIEILSFKRVHPDENLAATEAKSLPPESGPVIQ